MVEKFFWYILNSSQNLKNILNFFLNFFTLIQIEIGEIVFVKNNMSLFIHTAKLTQKLSICKFFLILFRLTFFIALSANGNITSFIAKFFQLYHEIVALPFIFYLNMEVCRLPFNFDPDSYRDEDAMPNKDEIYRLRRTGDRWSATLLSELMGLHHPVQAFAH